jgi:hypothetical protein
LLESFLWSSFDLFFLLSVRKIPTTSSCKIEKESAPSNALLNQNPASLPPAVQEDHLPPPTVLPIDDEPSLVTAADFATGIPSNLSIEVLADIMHKTVDLLGDEVTTKRLKNLTFVGSRHAKKLASYEARLFIVLEKHYCGYLYDFQNIT